MLKQRLITAFILAAFIIWSILGLTSELFSIVLAVFVAVGGWEWTRMVNFSSLFKRLFFMAALILSMFMTNYLGKTEPLLAMIVLSIAAIWWVICGYIIVNNIKIFVLSTQNLLMGTFTGLLVLLPPWYALSVVHANENYGPYYVLYILVLIGFADAGAYFTGRKLGSNKLAPEISPGKTWEGIWGAAVVVTVTAIASGYLLMGTDVAFKELMLFMLLSLVTFVFTVFGDLFESMMKRQAGLKDSGSILPGHGGVLDRIDSITAAAPVFVAGLLLLELV